MRIALGLAYHGARFDGWQTQPSRRAVQDHVQAALAVIAGQAVGIVAAGRTDAGVHATGQVVHFDAPVRRPPNAWVRGTNAHLPAGVSIRWAVEVPDDFHARFSARSRTYVYLLQAGPTRPALLDGLVGWFHLPLDIGAMRSAAAHLIGRHDFTSFRAASCQARTPVRTIHELTIVQRGAYIVITVRADAFLHHMVRNIVGALVYVGKGAHPPHWMTAVLAARDRTGAPPTFAPDGLALVEVEYDARFGLPDRTADGTHFGRIDLPWNPG